MGLFDSILKSAEHAVKRETAKAVSNAASSIGKGTNRSEAFTFNALPNNVAELQALPEASLDSAFKTTALTIAALCAYEKDPDANYSSLGGLIFNVLTQIPDDGNTPELETDTLKIRVEEILNHRVEWALVSKLPPKVEEDDEDEEDEKRDRKRRKDEDDD